MQQETTEFTTLDKLPQVRILGRTTGRETVNLFWTASGIELEYTGSELWLALNADYGEMEPWLAVELNGVCISRFPVAKGQSEVCLFRGMTAGKAKHVRVLKEVQAMSGDPEHLLQIRGLRYVDGKFLPLPEPKCRIEFIGDSITSGEGAMGATIEEDWISAFFSAENSYPRMVAEALSAEYRVVSQSGWGVVTGWDGDVNHKLPPYYTQICGLLEGERNRSLGSYEPYDFAAWQPDAIVINLCTNDVTAMQIETVAEGEAAPAQELHWADAKNTAEAAALLTTGIQQFLATVRRCNPHAQILWCYGMLGQLLLPVIRAAVEQYTADTADTGIHFLQLPDTTAETVGSRCHPGVRAHRDAAQVLAAYIKTLDFIKS